jgi:hypothetical protein
MITGLVLLISGWEKDWLVGRYVQLGTLRMIVPPIISATICTASPTDLSWVVLVVVKPISRMMIVEKELTTPFGMALIDE